MDKIVHIDFTPATEAEGFPGWMPDDPDNPFAAPGACGCDMNCDDYGICPWGNS